MYRDIEKIKTAEEYEATRKEIDYYVNEYNWVLNSKNPEKEVEEKVKELMSKMDRAQTKEEELETLRAIHLLQNKYVSIKNGRYAADLKRNITANLIRVEQYEASLEQRTAMDVLKGIIRNDSATKDYLQRKYMISLVNTQGIIPDPVNLRLESPEDIIEYIGEHYNLVGIEVPKREEMSLVATEEVERNALEKLLNKKAEERINESSTIEKTIDNKDNTYITEEKPKAPSIIKTQENKKSRSTYDDERGI